MQVPPYLPYRATLSVRLASYAIPSVSAVRPRRGGSQPCHRGFFVTVAATRYNRGRRWRSRSRSVVRYSVAARGPRARKGVGIGLRSDHRVRPYRAQCAISPPRPRGLAASRQDGTIRSVAATSDSGTRSQTLRRVSPLGAWQEDRVMPRYVILVNWTEQGARSVTETTKRAEQVRQMIEQMGGWMEPLLWTQGRYDLVDIMETPDEETAAATGLRVGMGGGSTDRDPPGIRRRGDGSHSCQAQLSSRGRHTRVLRRCLPVRLPRARRRTRCEHALRAGRDHALRNLRIGRGVPTRLTPMAASRAVRLTRCGPIACPVS
jgi:uncharacterized protein with GYD domain